ncbi:TetR family transcriptional regulator [Aquitalea palustris]|uniref:TetR family transcriptional regulator n=1 Tax=Aquitalea palustris TaxID=2480983 RepID=UPI001314A500|nr:TetR family transcriptional regulator [Aquitalea palustris]
MARKTKEEADKTRQLLLDAAEQLFWEQGVSKTTLAGIAEHAGLTRGAIYWHFDNKSDLFNAMCERAFPQFEEMMQALLTEDYCPELSPAQRLWQHSCEVLQLVATSPRIARVVGIINLRCEFVGEMQNSFLLDRTWLMEKVGNLHAMLSQAAERGQVRPGIDLACASGCLHSMICGLVDSWMLNPQVVDLENHCEQLLTPFFAGVFVADCWLPAAQ